jgi:hypothetical protein
METLLMIGLLLLTILNMYASIKFYRDFFPSRNQGVAQIAFIWFLPMLGAALILRLLRNELQQSIGKYPAKPNVGDEYVTGLGRLNSEGYLSSPDDNFLSS